MQENWWLGFLGFVGIYKLPDILGAFHGDNSPWEYIYLSWLLWLLYFVPEKARTDRDHATSRAPNDREQ